MSNTELPYSSPKFHRKTFHCPFCRAYSKQRWVFPPLNFEGVVLTASQELGFSRCDNCTKVDVWIDQELVFPVAVLGISPNPDLSADIKTDFNEARKILNDSPRGAAALLRLAVQKMCIELGGKGKNINDDIALLVTKGLPPQIQQALDVVRVVGNNAVHPGSLDMKDGIEIATKMFTLVNLVAEVMISQPKHVKAMYDSLVPEGAQESIQKRDGT